MKKYPKFQHHKTNNMQQNQTTLFKTGKPAGLMPEGATGYVYVTKDYSKFRHLDGNRNIVRPHLKRLKDAIIKKYLFSPILVNEKYEIIDGQHRFEVVKELKLPLYYLIKKNYGLEEVQMLNSNLRNWSTDDYMNSYIELGLKDYELYKLFRQEFGFDHHSCLAMLTGSQNKEVNVQFRLGDFKIKDYKRGVQSAEKIRMVGQYYKGYTRRYFVAAMLRCFNHKDYNHSVFLNKLSYQSVKMVDCTDTKDYLTLMEEIYNYRSRDKMINLRFMENENESNAK